MQGRRGVRGRRRDERTGVRSVEARRAAARGGGSGGWCWCVAQTSMSHETICAKFLVCADKEGIGWSNTPFYVVGQSTASALHVIHASPHSASPYCPRDIRGSTESGTGDKLAHFIVNDLSSVPLQCPASKNKKLLYLTGDKTKGTLPAIAKAAGFEVESLQVYATQGSTRFEDDLSAFLELERGDQGEHPVSHLQW